MKNNPNLSTLGNNTNCFKSLEKCGQYKRIQRLNGMSRDYIKIVSHNNGTRTMRIGYSFPFSKRLFKTLKQHARMKDQRRYILQKQCRTDRICAEERQALKHHQLNLCPIMFTGDRGYGIGSPIKGHLKYGGKWKPTIHSRYTPVVITNEHNTSQNCPFCFQKLSHSYKQVEVKGEQVLQSVSGTFECQNQYCIRSVKNKACMPRDATSALSIGLSGLSRIAFSSPFPTFNEKPSPSDTENFDHLAHSFLKKKQE